MCSNVLGECVGCGGTKVAMCSGNALAKVG